MPLKNKYIPDENLAKVLGTDKPLMSYEIIKLLWKYIRENCEKQEIKKV